MGITPLLRYYGRSDFHVAWFFVRPFCLQRNERQSRSLRGSPVLTAHHFDSHSATNHPTSSSGHPFPCSVNAIDSALDGLDFALG
jgi:hypothetical protein